MNPQKTHPLTELRERNHLTRRDLYELLGGEVALRTIFNVEHGLKCSKPTRRKILAVIEKLEGYDPSVDYFVSWSRWGPRALPIEGWFWLAGQLQQDQFEKASRWVSSRGYAVPERGLVRGALRAMVDWDG